MRREIDCCDARDWRRLFRGMPLHVAALRAREVLEPAPRRVERVAQRDLQVGVVLVRDGDFTARREMTAASTAAAAIAPALQIRRAPMVSAHV